MKGLLMIRRLIFLLTVALVSTSVRAQEPYRAFEQITVAGSSIGFTTAKISNTGGHPQANYATCRLETAQVRYTYDGTTPTSTVGTPLDVGDVLTLLTNEQLQIFRAIRTGGTSGQLDCTYGS